jgi:glycerophosphoryl diester phosphodiesterase
VQARGLVREHTLAELCALDAGAWFALEYAGARVPSLEDVLDLTAGRAALNVEIKSPASDWDATARGLIDLLTAKQRLDSTIVSSFEMGALRAVRERCAEARLGVCGDDLDRVALGRRAVGASVHPQWALVNPAVVDEARRRGLSDRMDGEQREAIAALASIGVREC